MAHAGSPCGPSKLSTSRLRPFDSARASSSVNLSAARVSLRPRLCIILRYVLHSRSVGYEDHSAVGRVVVTLDYLVLLEMVDKLSYGRGREPQSFGQATNRTRSAAEGDQDLYVPWRQVHVHGYPPSGDLA